MIWPPSPVELPPADHNISGLPSLTREENACVEQARAALASVRHTFEFWVAIARGLATLGQGPTLSAVFHFRPFA